MGNNRKSKILKIVCIYLILIGIIVATGFASNDVKFNHYQTIGSPVIQLENYLGQFFETGWLIVLIGCLFALIWACRLQNQIRHAKWFRNSVIVTSILTCMLVLLAFFVPLSRIDCGDSCVWYILPTEIVLLMGIISTILYFGVSIWLYKFMIRNSTKN